MKRKHIYVIALSAGIFSLGLINNVSISADTYDTQIAAKQTTINKANATLSALSNSATALKDQGSTSAQKLVEVNTSLKTLGTALSDEQAVVDSLKASLKVTPQTSPVKENSKTIKNVLPTTLVTPLVTEATTQLEAEKASVSDYEIKIANLQKQFSQLKTDIKNNAEKISAVTNTIKNTTNQVKVAKDSITTLKAQQEASKSVAGLRSQLVAAAYAQLGKPYVWGGQGPDVFDCSGLMNYLYSTVAHLSIGSWTSPQETSGVQIAVSAAQPGDLLFFGSPGATSHVAMYIGGGQFIHAPQPGEVVKVTSMSYYAPTFAVRVLGN